MTEKRRYVLIFASEEGVVREAICNEAAEKTKEEKSGEIGEVSPLYRPKTRNGFSQFLLRGLEKVKLEWKIVATAHNLLKITAAIMRKELILPALG